ncbi:MAG: hypothetical protein HZB23_06555 [Deltaproteobacteria bacterium]|nr:hypothetical protein [Deltaproteobacteria bacterium]
MKRILIALCLLFALALSFSSCGDKKEEPRVAAKELGLTAQLAENGKILADLAVKMDALVAAVTPDRQRTAMIIIKENMEKAALVCMYEARVMDGAVASIVKTPDPKAADEKFTRKSVVAQTSSEALARFSGAAQKALEDVYNKDAITLAQEALGLAADSSALLKQGVGLAAEAKGQAAAPAKTEAAAKPVQH